ncbi:hypothetical protein GQ54DRAFT_83066 [Martensiomyces pterosporus]|nr:hypothetical protein GQ54DRAFT_83066 [Martensiomyces pterosporus]
MFAVHGMQMIIAPLFCGSWRAGSSWDCGGAEGAESRRWWPDGRQSVCMPACTTQAHRARRVRWARNGPCPRMPACWHFPGIRLCRQSLGVARKTARPCCVGISEKLERLSWRQVQERGAWHQRAPCCCSGSVPFLLLLPALILLSLPRLLLPEGTCTQTCVCHTPSTHPGVQAGEPQGATQVWNEMNLHGACVLVRLTSPVK